MRNTLKIILFISCFCFFSKVQASGPLLEIDEDGKLRADIEGKYSPVENVKTARWENDDSIKVSFPYITGTIQLEGGEVLPLEETLSPEAHPYRLISTDLSYAPHPEDDEWERVTENETFQREDRSIFEGPGIFVYDELKAFEYIQVGDPTVGYQTQRISEYLHKVRSYRTVHFTTKFTYHDGQEGWEEENGSYSRTTYGPYQEIEEPYSPYYRMREKKELKEYLIEEYQKLNS